MATPIDLKEGLRRAEQKAEGLKRMELRRLLQKSAYGSDRFTALDLDSLYLLTSEMGLTIDQVVEAADALKEARSITSTASDLPRRQAQLDLVKADAEGKPGKKADVDAAQEKLDEAKAAAERLNALRASHGHLL